MTVQTLTYLKDLILYVVDCNNNKLFVMYFKNWDSKTGNENLTKSFKEIVVETAESFDGLSGKIKLNKAGDRVSENYDFWIVAKDNDTQGYECEKEHNFKKMEKCHGLYSC